MTNKKQTTHLLLGRLPRLDRLGQRPLQPPRLRLGRRQLPAGFRQLRGQRVELALQLGLFGLEVRDAVRILVIRWMGGWAVG
jgi:hypothetical protein